MTCLMSTILRIHEDGPALQFEVYSGLRTGAVTTIFGTMQYGPI